MSIPTDTSIWLILLIVLGIPLVVVGTLNFLLRKRGGLSAAWGGALVLGLAGITALLVILDKVRI